MSEMKGKVCIVTYSKIRNLWANYQIEKSGIVWEPSSPTSALFATSFAFFGPYSVCLNNLLA
jgi:hypothetical protein